MLSYKYHCRCAFPTRRWHRDRGSGWHRGSGWQDIVCLCQDECLLWRLGCFPHKHFPNFVSVKPEVLIALDSWQWLVEGTEVDKHIAGSILCSHQLGGVGASTPINHRRKFIQ